MSPPEGPHNLFQDKTQVEKNLFIIMYVDVVHHVLGCRKLLLTKYICSRSHRHVSLCHTGGSKCLTPQLVMRIHWLNMTTNLSTYHQPINLRNIIWKYNQISPKQTDLMIDVLLLLCGSLKSFYRNQSWIKSPIWFGMVLSVHVSTWGPPQPISRENPSGKESFYNHEYLRSSPCTGL